MQDLMRSVGESFVDTIFDTIIQMLRLKHVTVIDEWIQVFENFLCNVKFTKYEKTINDEFFRLSGITSPSINKATSMRILGILLKVKKGQVSDQMLEIAQLFSQTAEFEIKQRLLNYVIEYVFIYLPKEQHEKYWNEKLLEFLQDPHVQIKCDSIEIVSRILDKLNDGFKANKIKILFFDLMNAKQKEVKLAFSRFIGPYIFNLKTILDQKPQNQTLIFSNLQEYCESNEGDVRVNFLYNLPGILQVYGKKIWTNLNKQYYNMLLKDEVIEVRIQAINIYPYIIDFIGKAESKNLIKQHMKAIINDEASQPKNQFVKILPQIFELYKDDLKANRQFFSESLKEFLDILENTINSPNWRFLLSVIQLVESDFSLFDSFEMNDLYFPIIFQALLKGCTEIRKAALATIIKYLETNQNKNDRDAVIQYVANNFYLARSYQQKVSYVMFVENILEKFDFQIFRANKFINILNYHLDKVPQLRKQLTRLLAPIHEAIYQSAEKDQFNKLLDACKNLLQDKDYKIQELAQKAVDEICEEDSNFMEKVNNYVSPHPISSHSEIKSANYISEDLDVTEYSKMKQNRRPSEKPFQATSKTALTSNTALRKNYQSSTLTIPQPNGVRNNSGQKNVSKTMIGTTSKSNSGSISQLPAMTSPAKKIPPTLPVSTATVSKKYQLPEGIPKKSDLTKPSVSSTTSVNGLKATNNTVITSGVASKIVPNKMTSQNAQSFSNIGKANITSVKPTALLKK